MHQTPGIWVDLRIIINETYPAEEVQTYNLLQISAKPLASAGAAQL